MRAIRVGIYVLVAFAVLAHGAVEPWSEAVLEIGVALLFLAWGILTVSRRETEIRWNWLYLPLLALGGLALLQGFLGLSAYPYATKIELLQWAADVLLFFLAVESFRSVKELAGFAWFLLSFGFAVSLFGIIQHYTFNGKLYWLRPLHHGGIPFGPFVNRNHFAGFVELVIPMGLAMLSYGGVRRDRLPLLSLFTILPLGALVLSASRGGIVSFLFEIVFLGFLVLSRRAAKNLLPKAGALALVAGALVVWLGIGRTLQRFQASGPQEISRDRRVSMLKDTGQIFLHHPWLGTGLGTLETVYPHYESYYDGLIVNHTHNDYLELLADTGLIGGACGFAFLALLFWLGLKNLRSATTHSGRSFYAGSLVACAGLLVHSLVDFNLHIPSNALLFLLLASVATSGFSEPERRNHRAPRVQAGFPA